MTSRVTGSSVAVICVAHEIRRDVAACRGPLPPSLAGEGGGGGGKARILLRTSSLSLQPKSDVSDFGQSIKRPNSDKPKFGCRRGGGRRGAPTTSPLSHGGASPSSRSHRGDPPARGRHGQWPPRDQQPRRSTPLQER